MQVFSKVADCSKVPIVSAIGVSTACIIITLILSYEQILHVVSGGIILTFIVINYTTVIISYRKPTSGLHDELSNLVDNEVSCGNDNKHDNQDDVIKITDQDFQVVIVFGLFTKLCFLACLLFYFPKGWSFWSIRFPIICLIGLICIGVLIFIRTRYTLYTTDNQTFQCPLIPFVPGVGIAFMMFSFSNLELIAHILSVCYVIVGTVIYFSYGYFNSTITVNKRKNLNADSSEPIEHSN